MAREKGFSLIELLIVVAIILIIAAIAIPSLMRSKMAANNSAAAATMRTINTAQATYSISYPLSGYAGQWDQLGPSAPGTPCTAVAACLLDQYVACGGSGPCTRTGYSYFINDGTGAPGAGPNPAPGTAPNGNFTTSATPVKMDVTGNANFCSYVDAVVRTSSAAVPSIPIPPVLATPGEVLASCNDLTKYGSIQ